jgi:hypothetical protein
MPKVPLHTHKVKRSPTRRASLTLNATGSQYVSRTHQRACVDVCKYWANTGELLPPSTYLSTGEVLRSSC